MINFLLRRTQGRILALGVIAIVAVGAGWFFFIREDNGEQKEAAAVTDEVRRAAEATPTTAPAASAPGSAPASPTAGPGVAGTSTINGTSYTLVAGQSQAWYLAPEKLASLPTSSVAKGTTSDVKGEFHLSAGGLESGRATTFTVGLASLKSNESRRDGMVERALEVNRFPVATFTATQLEGMPAAFTSSDSVMQLSGVLEVHGVKREVTWELKVKRDGDILSGLATVKFKYADFGIRKPDIGGFVTVQDEVTIQVQLFAKQG